MDGYFAVHCKKCIDELNSEVPRKISGQEHFVNKHKIIVCCVRHGCMIAEFTLEDPLEELKCDCCEPEPPPLRAV